MIKSLLKTEKYQMSQWRYDPFEISDWALRPPVHPTTYKTGVNIQVLATDFYFELYIPDNIINDYMIP